VDDGNEPVADAADCCEVCFVAPHDATITLKQCGQHFCVSGAGRCSFYHIGALPICCCSCTKELLVTRAYWCIEHLLKNHNI